MSLTIIVTGSTGSGKTTAALAMSHYLSVPVLNVGDVLRDRLGDPGAERHEVGQRFLARYGFDAYLTLVLGATQPGMIVDGLRSAEVADAIRAQATRDQAVVVVACEKCPTAAADPFDDWVAALAVSATGTLPWFPGPEGASAKGEAAVSFVRSVNSKRL